MSKSMKKWLGSNESPSPSTKRTGLLRATTPDPRGPVPQLLPTAALRTLFAPHYSSSSVPRTFSQHPTLIEDASTRLAQLKQSPTLELPTQLPGYESDSDRGAELRPASEDVQDLGVSVPLPVPLHVIEAFTSRDKPKGSKTKRTNSDWSVSELKSFAEGAHPASTESDGQDSAKLCKINDCAVVVSMGNRHPETEEWASDCYCPPTVEFFYDGTRVPSSDQCDIDPCSGILLPPIDYPETHTEQSAGQCRDMRDIEYRRQYMTSEAWILREIKARARLEENIRAKMKEECKSTEVQPVEESWPTANCLLRPATPQDFLQIAAIFNRERRQEQSPQVMETTPVGVHDIEKIYESCRINLRPFVVAVPSTEDFLDRSKWPKGADKEFEEFARFKQSQKASKPNCVVGFAFVADSRLGLFGSPCYGSRFTGRITVLVHPDHRRKLYGSALLDRMLLSVAVYHRSHVDYKWDCPDPALIYEEPATRNRRKYAHVYIEALASKGETEKTMWMAKMLEKFEFQQVALFKQAVRTDRGINSEWLDLTVWDFEARPVVEITNETQHKGGMH
ncbi:hypothetical protein AK830_g10516 [Neonectria ditissima]|uniref:Uncharacterized protein n=1 Tax=Neonectria ditissima TaxID=78410 RepID=A0A0P7B613_9HYPO|nr:hypothetical protein AK830_g10516 [Neonectria ditissima]